MKHRKAAQVLIARAGGEALLTCEVATTFWQRLAGWMGKREARIGEGLYFPRCQSVHMWGMRISIDIVFLAQAGSKNASKGERVVTRVIKGARPWTPFPYWNLRAVDTLELAAGSIDRFRIREGDILCFAS